MTDPSRRVLVTGAHPLAVGLARGLADRSDHVLVTAPEAPGDWPADRFLPCGFASEPEVAAAVDTASGTLGGIDQVVHTWVAPELLGERALVDVRPGEWQEGCERSLDAGWWLSRHVSGHLERSERGSAVFVVPSLALSGAAGYVMLTAVGEGLRVLAKSCGAQWAARGITVNTVATSPRHWIDPGTSVLPSRALSLAPPAFGRDGDPADDLAPLVAALGAGPTGFLTAATLVADGAEWMGL